jgi:hypothetical protein
MRKRLLLSVFAALAIAGSLHVSVAAAPPEFLVCRLEDGTELQLLIENFGGMRDAVHHCLEFWHGHPAGVAR